MDTADIPVLKHVNKGYICPKCSKILRDPVQTSCGHRMCSTCAEVLITNGAKCPVEESCDVVVKEELHQDNYARRKINKEKVLCSFGECGDEFLLKDIENHEINCRFRGSVTMETEEEASKMQNAEKEEIHGNLQDIVMQLSEKKKQMDKTLQGLKKFKKLQGKDMQNVHQMEKSVDHIQIKARTLSDEIRTTVALSEEACEKIDDFQRRRDGNEHYRDLELLRQSIEELSWRVNDLLDNYRSLEFFFTVQQSEAIGIPVRNHADRDDQILAQAEVDENSSDRMETGLAPSDVPRVTPFPVTDINTDADVAHALSHHNQQLNILDMQYLAANVGLLRAQTVKNGYIIWKFTDYSKKKQSDRPSCYSQPFYTSSHGYKVQAKVYLNGDGMGYGRYLSLYLQKIKGNFDNMLTLPIHCRITMAVLNPPNYQNDVSKSVEVDMTDGGKYGFPEFMTIDVLENTENGYIVDNTLFVKVVVEVLS